MTFDNSIYIKVILGGDFNEVPHMRKNSMYGLMTFYRGIMKDSLDDIYQILDNNLAHDKRYATYGNEKNSWINDPEMLDYILHKSKSHEVTSRTERCEIQEDEFKYYIAGENRSLSDHSPLACTIRLQGK